MATMIPDSVKQFTTDGEWQTYRFLEAVAKPDARFLCWYLPEVRRREPDIILYSRQNGLIILEVKDWNLNQIREANPQHFVLDMGGKTEKRKNQLKQARDYLNGVLDKIKGDGWLVSRDPTHHGNPKLPIDCDVVFLDELQYHLFLLNGIESRLHLTIFYKCNIFRS